jgi:hypothetical protein
MDEKYHLYYVDAIITTPVKLHIRARNENEAFGRSMDGAWHGCYPEPTDWSKAKVTHIGPITKGPGTT